MKQKAPGKFYRVGLSLIELAEMIPDEATATKWFETIMWEDGCSCPYCLSSNVAEKKNRKPMPYRCRDCRKHFSVRTGTVIERSHIPLKKWGVGHLSLDNQPEGCLCHEVVPRREDELQVGLVHGAPTSGVLQR